MRIVVLLVAATPLAALDEVIAERNRNWTATTAAYFDGAHCLVESAEPCPREMGWQGNEFTWDFALPAGAATTAQLRFELVVDRVDNPVAISLAAGTISIARPGVYRWLIPATAFREGARNEVTMRGDNEVGFGKPSGIRWMAAGLYRHYETPPAVTDEELLDDTQWRACRYFYEQATASGLVFDRLGTDVASIGATGFGATAMTILAERANSKPRWSISGEAARARAELMMDAVLAIQARQKSSEAEWGRGGIPYHFVDGDGRRARQSEVSTVDGALLVAGLLQAGEYFGGDLRAKANAILDSTDFKRFYRAATNRYSHGWTPESGLLAGDWDRPTDEILLICLISLANDPDDPERLAAFYGYPRVSESYRGVPVVRSFFGSLFTYTFAHSWIPFDCLGSDRPAAAGMPAVPAVDWWLNARRAAEANRLYHEDQLARYPALGADSWGASACYRADRIDYFGPNGAEPAEIEPAFDGTLPPHGAIMSLFLTRTSPSEPLGSNPGFRALRHYYATRFATLWSSYGPRSSFDQHGNTSAVVVGIEKGPEALGIEAYLTGMPGRVLIEHPAIARAAARVFERSDCPPSFVRGWVNGDRSVDIADAVYVLSYLFADGPEPACEDAADANDDGSIDIGDPITLLSHLFNNAPAPVAPYPACGPDPTGDRLECASFPQCLSAWRSRSRRASRRGRPARCR